MKENWQALLAVLNEMLAVYRSLFELSGEKRRLLVRARPDELEAVNRLEESLVIQGSELENRRAKTTAGLVTRLGLPGTLPTLTELAAAADAETAMQLQGLSRELGAVLKELSRANAVNAKLTQQALAFVNFNLNLLTRNQAETTYAPAGAALTQRSGVTLLDRKV